VNPNIHRAIVHFLCRSGHTHKLGVEIKRGVPPELRHPEEQSTGYGSDGGTGCPLPEDLSHRVEQQLRDAFQESKRRGFVLIEK
jgi:hypothetical protein